MSRKHITIIAFVCFLLSLYTSVTKASDEVGIVPIPTDSKAYNPQQETLFTPRKYVDQLGTTIYVVDENTGITMFEVDVNSDLPLQKLVKDESDLHFIDNMGYLTRITMENVYGVPAGNIKIGNIWFGPSSMYPNGSTTIVDFKFIRNGRWFTARFVTVIEDIDSIGGSNYFVIYPTTRN